MSDVNNTDTSASTDASEKVELTLDQKIEQAEARLAKLRQQKLTESLLNNIEKGDKVTIKFGRADKVRHIDGEVVGVALPNIAVLAGDLETYKVHVRDVVANPTAAERNDLVPVQDVEEIDPTTGRRPEEAGGVDATAISTLEGEGGIVADNSADPLENA
ncbi:hypothetical protein SPS_4 [Sphingomonas phage Scott]|uniref:Uncharacterized protein n=1 Tax=Sphingomonas phage Scott TaxID=2282912 RepID=A0A346FDA1_9CAUD|nr:hypothetical protein HOT83_gp04 [Sphingomonas phage Scott]AXN53715.1 hypothetical protein SPS_4 [Sphingomonas phage Scott]